MAKGDPVKSGAEAGYYWLKHYGSTGPYWQIVWYARGVRDGVGKYYFFHSNKERLTDDEGIIEWGPRLESPE